VLYYKRQDRVVVADCITGLRSLGEAVFFYDVKVGPWGPTLGSWQMVTRYLPYR